MGVSLDIWRQRIGCFILCQRAQKLQWRTQTLKPPHVTGYGLRLALLLITLLVVAGDVESNPGPNQSREYDHKTESYNTQEVLDILQNPDWDRVIREPPVKPRAGQVFLYHITEDAKKDDWRCDQYHFHHDGTRKQPKKNPKFSKLFFLLKTSQGKDNRFKKHAFILLEGNTNLVLFQYLGDEGVAEDLPHGNSKNPKSVYTRLCPSLIRSIKNISLKPSDALRQLNKEAEGSSVPELYRPRSIIHVINTKCRKPKKPKEPRDSKQDIHSRNGKSTVDTTSVPERSTRKRSSSKETGYEPETKRTPGDDGDGNREKSESSTLQTVCPGTLQIICPNISDLGVFGPADRETQITGSVQQSGKPNIAIDNQNSMDIESTVGLARTLSAGESNGISSESITLMDSKTDVPANHVNQNHSPETINRNQSSFGSNTNLNPTLDPSISTNQNSSCKVQDQHMSSSSSFTCSNTGVDNIPCIALQESKVNPVIIPNLQQESICIVADWDRNNTNPTMAHICTPYLQELNINDDQLTEVIELLLDIVKTWNNQQQGITDAIDLTSTSSVSSCGQDPCSDVQSGTCATRVASILPPTAVSLITQCGELWIADFIRERQILSQTEVVKVALQSEIQPKDSLLTLLTAILLGAQKTKSDVIRFLDTLIDLPSHLQTTDDKCSEVQVDTDYRIGTYTVRGRDIDRLNGTAWMDDSVIHAYLWLLKDQTSEDNVFVLECFLAKLWEKEKYSEWLYEQYILKDYNWILLPVWRNHHWLLMAANVGNRTVCVINSKPSNSMQTEMFLHWRKYMTKRSEVTGEDLSYWREESYPVFPQTDGSSCGIYVLMAAEALLSGVSPGIMRNCHVTGYRKYVRQRLLSSAVPVCGPENQDCEMDDVQVMTVEGIGGHQKESNTEKNNKQHISGDKKAGRDSKEMVVGDVCLMDSLDVSDIRRHKSGQAQHTLSGGQSEDKSKDVLMECVDNSQIVKEEYCHMSEETATTKSDSEDCEMVHAATTTQSCMVLTSDVCNFNNTQEYMKAIPPEAKELIEHLFLNEKGSFTALTLLCLLNGNLKLSELDILRNERSNTLHHYLKWSRELSGCQGMDREDIRRELNKLDSFVDITEDNIAMLRDPDVQRLTYEVLSNHAVDYISNIDLKFIYHYVRLQKQKTNSSIVFTKNNAHLLAARLAKEIIQGNLALTVSHNVCEYFYFDILLKKALLAKLENDRSSDISFGGSFIHWLCFSKNAELFKCLSGMLTEKQKLDCVIPCCLSGNVDILQIICTEFDTTQIRDVSQYHRKLPVISIDRCICDSPVEVSDTYFLPPLHLACYWGHCDIVSCLLESGLDVNEQLNDGRPECEQIPKGSTPASFAAARGHADVMRCLIENKADLNLHDTNFDTPLHIACGEGHSDIVSLIVQHCNLLERNIHGDTSLHIACQTDAIENVITLMRRGSDFNLLNYENYTPLDIACEKGYRDIVEYMVDTYGYPLPCNGSNTPLHKACRGGFTHIVQLLLKHDAERSVTLDGNHPLYIAVAHNNSRIVDLMLEHSSHNVLIQQDDKLLLNSIKSGFSEIVKLLLEKGADVSVDGGYGYTPLSAACKGGHVEIVKLLLEKGADLSVTDDYGYAPLFTACKGGHVEIVKLLLEKGAGVSVTVEDGYASLITACEGGHVEIVKLLLEKGAEVSVTDEDGYTPLITACKGGHVEIVKLLLEKSADVSVTGAYGYAPLITACMGGHVEIVKLLLEKSADVSVTDEDGYTPLITACEGGHAEIVKLLLEKSADVSVTDEDGYTPLIIACKGGHAEIVKLLLEKSADVSVTDEDGYTPLITACNEGHVEIVKLLLEKSADVSVTDEYGNTPLITAYMGGHAEIVKMLLEKGTDVSVDGGYGYDLLISACKGGHVEIVKLLLEKGAEVSVTDEDGYAPLITACKGGHVEIVKLLLEKSADVSVTDEYGYTPLITACKVGHAEIVKLLLEKSADVSVTDKDGYTPLITACKGGHVEIVKLLLEKSADVSVTDEDGYTPLITACKGGHVEIVKLLLEKSADVSVTGAYGYTPLITACMGGHAEIVKLLLEKSADVSVTDEYGNTPLITACMGGHAEIVKMLLEKGTDVSVDGGYGYDLLISACKGGHVEIVKLLLEKGAEVSVTDEDGYTPLITACKGGHAEIVKLLLEKSADVSVTGGYGCTPLGAACKGGHVEMVKLLLEKSADVSVTDEYGYTPLITACKGGHVEIVKLLLEKSADVSVTDEYGYTPLITACKGGHAEIVKLLLEKSADVSVTDEDGNTPLITACKGGHAEIVKLLLEKSADVSVTGGYGYTPLSAACKGGQEEIVKLLLEKGADVSVTGGYGYAPLSAACMGGHAEIVKMLLEKGTDVSVDGGYGYDLLITACKGGHVEIVKLLLEKGADVSVTDEYGYTPLITACKGGHVEIVKLLLEKSVDVSVTDGYGNDPLISACKEGHVEIVKLLLEKGADVSVTDVFGDTPLSAAREGGHVDILKLLLEKSAKLSLVTASNGNTLFENTEVQSENSFCLPLATSCNARFAKASVGEGTMYVSSFNIETKERKYDRLHKNCDTCVKDMASILIEMNPTAVFTSVGQDGISILATVVHYGHRSVLCNIGNRLFTIPLSTEHTHCLIKSVADIGDGHLLRLLIDHFIIYKQIQLTCDEILIMSISKCKYYICQMLIDFCKCAEIETVTLEAYHKGSPFILNKLTGSRKTNLTFKHIHSKAVGLNRKCLDIMADGFLFDCSAHFAHELLHSACVLGHQSVVKHKLDTQNVNSDEITNMFHQVLKYGHTSIAQDLINAGADINAISEKGMHPLHIVCQRGHNEIAAMLITAMSDIDKKDRLGRTALYLACSNMHHEIVKLLVTNGAQVTCPNCPSPLHMVCKIHNEQMLQVMIECNPTSVDDLDLNGDSPLHVSIRHNNISAVKILLENKANYICTDKKGRIILHTAFERGNIDLIKILLQHTTCLFRRDDAKEMPVSILYKNQSLFKLICENIPQYCLSDADDDGNTLLHHACMSGFHDCVLSLLHRTDNKSCVNKHKETALHITVEKGHQKSVRVLLQFGFDCNSINDDSHTPLHIASSDGCFEIVKLLLESKPNVNAKDASLKTPLHYAAKCGHANIVHILIIHGADIESDDVNSDKPLHLACDSRDVDTVQILVRNTSDINVAGHKGRTPLHRAVAMGSIKIVDHLLKSGAKSIPNRFNNTPLYVACVGGHLEIMKLLLKSDDMLQITGINGYFYVVISCIRQHENMLKYLIKNGASMSPISISCPTPLSISFSDILQDEEENVEYIEKSAITGIEGKTPLDVALDGYQLEIVKFILTESMTSGIEICDSDNRKNILSKICKKGNLQIAKLFLKACEIPLSDLMQIILEGNNRDSTVTSNFNKIGNKSIEGVKQMGSEVLEVIDEEDDITDDSPPLVTSCESGNYSIASLLIAFASGHLKDLSESHLYENQPPLHLAYDLGLMDVVSCLASWETDISLVDDNGYTIFHKACECGDTNTVNMLFGNNMLKAKLLNQIFCKTTKDGEMSLHIAARKGHVDIIDLFVQHGMNIGYITTEGNNALHVACSYGKHKVCRYLLEKEPALAISWNYERLLPLDIGLRRGNHKILKLFMSNQDPHLYNTMLDIIWAYLHGIMYNQNIQLLRPLMACVSFVDLIDQHGNTLLHISARYGNNSVTNYLLKTVGKHSVMLVNHHGDTPLHTAVWYGHTAIMQSLVPVSNIEAVNKFGDTPLHLAALKADYNAVELLLAYGASQSICLPNNYGNTSLHNACCRNSLVIIGKLLALTDNIDIQNCKGKSSLHLACEHGNAGAVDLVLKVILLRKSYNDRSCDIINMQDTEDCSTPLHLACHSNTIQGVTLLLKHGADTTIKDKNGKMPVFVACEAGHINIVKLLLPYTNLADLDNTKGTLLHFVCRCGNVDLLRLILDHIQTAMLNEQNSYDQNSDTLMSSLEAVDCERQTVLHVSSKYGHADCVEQLLQHRPRLNTTNVHGQTPLHNACISRCVDTVSLLLQHDVFLSPTDSFGMTPLHYACLNGSLTIADKLLNAGVDCYITDPSGSTPFELCTSENRHILTRRYCYERKRHMDSPLVLTASSKKPKTDGNEQQFRKALSLKVQDH